MDSRGRLVRKNVAGTSVSVPVGEEGQRLKSPLHEDETITFRDKDHSRSLYFAARPGFLRLLDLQAIGRPIL
jgi:hypothetical protein